MLPLVCFVATVDRTPTLQITVSGWDNRSVTNVDGLDTSVQNVSTTSKSERMKMRKGVKKKPKRYIGKQEQAHRAMEEEHEHADEGITFTAKELAGVCNFDTYDPHNIEEIDDRLIFYTDWLADTTTSSHITNVRNAFVAFQPLIKQISGVGNAKAYAQGRGTVGIRTQYNRTHYNIILKDVLYVPQNPHNLLSLGH